MNATTALTNLHKASLALVAVAVLCGSAALSADAATNASVFATVAHPTSLRNGDAVMGALPMTQPIHIEVALKMRDRAGLDAFIADNAKAASHGGAQQLMTSDQFLANHAPTMAQAQVVANYLTSMGYTNIVIAPNRLLVSADGTAANARNAFMTTFAQVKTHDGRIAFANTDEVRIPATLSDKIQSVVGLQNVHQAHTFARETTTASAHPYVVTAHNPLVFPTIYGAGKAPLPVDVVVGIVDEGADGPVSGDTEAFASNNSLPFVDINGINTNGTSFDTTHVKEWDLDAQDVLGMAGGQVNKFILYNIPSLSDSDLTADYNTIVAANVAKIAIASVGECETDAQTDGSAAADDTIFEAAVVQGQTFSIPTGNSGADECGDGTHTPSWPASSQYVVAVTGTTVHTNATTNAWNNETVWSDSGGGESTFEPKPSWQTLWTGPRRGVADVAYDGDVNSGATIIVNGASTQAGGTGLSAALFAGAWARMLQRYPGIGFAGPMIYALQSGDFHDITSGNNGSANAKVGYDLASGRGSMIVGKSVTDAKTIANQPPVANFSYTTTGLAANFTDTSTDSDGTIASHAWTFGDGGTSTAANPSHTYAANGTYTVTETVTDNIGASKGKTQSVTLGPMQLLQNTSFENGPAAPWQLSTPAMLSNTRAHTGSWCVFIGYQSGGPTDNLAQVVAIPSGKTSATLKFYVNNFGETDDFSTDDDMVVEVYNPVSHAKLGTVADIRNTDLPHSYVLKTYDMTPYIGQQVNLKFMRYNSSSGSSSLGAWAIDDITLTVQ